MWESGIASLICIFINKPILGDTVGQIAAHLFAFLTLSPIVIVSLYGVMFFFIGVILYVPLVMVCQKRYIIHKTQLLLSDQYSISSKWIECLWVFFMTIWVFLKLGYTITFLEIKTVVFAQGLFASLCIETAFWIHIISLGSFFSIGILWHRFLFNRIFKASA